MYVSSARKSPLMHLKSYQIDGRWLRTGAANFSASGLKRQDNDLLIIDSQAAATAFERRFDAIFAGGEAFPLASGGQSPHSCAPSWVHLKHPEGRLDCSGAAASRSIDKEVLLNREFLATSLSDQYARSRRTSKHVRNKILISSPSDQLLIYHKSNFTRSAICSKDAVSPRNPLTCAQPVMPGLT